MPRKHFPYVNAYKDRTGKMRYYFRRGDRPRMPLRGIPGSSEFVRSYADAVAGQPLRKKTRLKTRLLQGFVYYLEDGDFIKIGFTVDWQKRRKQYLTHGALPPKLIALHPGTQKDEIEIQRRFKKYRVRREWFSRGDELLQHIGTIPEPCQWLTTSIVSQSSPKTEPISVT